MKVIGRLLADAGMPGEWKITPASEGSSGRTFVARQQDRAVFVKLGDWNPGRERLVELGPIDPTPEERGVYKGFSAVLEGPDEAAVRLAFIQGSFLATDDADRKLGIIETMCSVPRWVAAAGICGVVAWDGLAALRLCDVPSLVMLSQTGGINDPARLLARKPDVHIGVTVGTGHFHQLEAPDQVTPMIERFMRVAIPAPVV